MEGISTVGGLVPRTFTARTEGPLVTLNSCKEAVQYRYTWYIIYVRYMYVYMMTGEGDLVSTLY